MDTSAEKAGELDRALIHLEHGVDIAMQVRGSSKILKLEPIVFNIAFSLYGKFLI